jgi:hypothetical protein
VSIPRTGRYSDSYSTGNKEPQNSFLEAFPELLQVEASLGEIMLRCRRDLDIGR